MSSLNLSHLLTTLGLFHASEFVSILITKAITLSLIKIKFIMYTAITGGQIKQLINSGHIIIIIIINKSLEG